MGGIVDQHGVQIQRPHTFEALDSLTRKMWNKAIIEDLKTRIIIIYDKNGDYLSWQISKP